MKPREIISAAASVRGARSLGIETEASLAAPDILRRGEEELAALRRKAAAAEPSAPDLAHELAWAKIASKVEAMEAATAELREALGIVQEPDLAKPEPTPKLTPEPAVPSKEEAERAYLSSKAISAWEKADEAHRIRDFRGLRVGAVEKYTNEPGRLPGELDPWVYQGTDAVAEDGHILPIGDVVVLEATSQEYVLVPSHIKDAAWSIMPRPLDENAAVWLPPGAVPPKVTAVFGGRDWVAEAKVASDWEAAFAAAKKAKEAKKAEEAGSVNAIAAAFNAALKRRAA